MGCGVQRAGCRVWGVGYEVLGVRCRVHQHAKPRRSAARRPGASKWPGTPRPTHLALPPAGFPSDQSFNNSVLRNTLKDVFEILSKVRCLLAMKIATTRGATTLPSKVNLH